MSPALLAVALLAGSIAVLLPGTPLASAAPAPAPAVNDTPTEIPTDSWGDDAAVSADAVGGADALPPECAITPPGSTTVRCTYAAKTAAAPADKPQWWARPAEVTSVGFELYGAQGGGASGGNGGKLTGTLDLGSAVTGIVVKPGERGGGGFSNGTGGPGGWPDGGAGGSSGDGGRAGCGGGGSTRLEINGYPVVVGAGGGCGGTADGASGGGGGAGGFSGATGGGGGSSHGSGSCDSSHGGGGGGAATQVSGGAPGGEGRYLSGISCVEGDQRAAAGIADLGGSGAHGESNGGGGGGGGGGAYGGGGGGGGQDTFPNCCGGGGGGGGGTGSVTGPISRPFTVTPGTNQVGEHAGAGSVVLTYQILPTQTTTSVSPTTVTAGTPVTLTADVVASPSNAVPVGEVLFWDVDTGRDLCPDPVDEPLPDDPPLEDPTPIMTVAVPGAAVPTGRATCTFTPTTAAIPYVEDGTIRVQAEYLGGAATLTSYDATPAVLTVGRAPTQTVISPGPQPGDVKVSVSTPGTTHVPFDKDHDVVVVRNDDGIRVCGPLALVWDDGADAATALCTVPLTPGQTLRVDAQYPGGVNTGPSTSALIDLTMAKVDTTTTWTTPETTAPFGSAITVKAFVEPATPGVPVDGQVVFFDTFSGIPGPYAPPGCGLVNLVAGEASCTLTGPAAAAGVHSITAIYAGGTATNQSPPSAPLTVTITRATPTVVLTADPAGGSTAGQEVTLSADVKIGSAAALQGTITFTDDGIAIGSCTDLAVAQPVITCKVTPTFGTSKTTHSFAAHVTGGLNITDADSNALSYEVGVAGTKTVLALESPATGPVTAGTPVTVAATVTVDPPVAGVTPTGTVTIRDNGQDIGCEAVALSGTGKAPCTWTPSAGATHNVSATYEPVAGGTTSGSSAQPLAFTVGAFPTTVALDVSPVADATSPVAGDTVTLTATVTTAAGGPLPSGTVTFEDGDVALCTTTTLHEVAGADPKAVTATCELKPAMGGAHRFTASYDGGGANGVDVSPPVDYVVQKVATDLEGGSASAASATELNLSVKVTTSTGLVPTGAVQFTVDGTDAGAPCPVSASSGVASCTRDADPTAAHTVDAVYTPDAAGTDSFLASPSISFAYDKPGACTTGEGALWADLADDGDATVGNLHNSITLSAGSLASTCGTTTFTATDLSLFHGMVKGDAAGVFTGGASGGSLCVTSGTFEAPVWLDLPQLSVSSPICWTITDAGDLGPATKGGVSAAVAQGEFPFLHLADIPAGEVSFAFDLTGGVETLSVNLVVLDGGQPFVTLGLTIGADGSFDGRVATPGLKLFGQSVLLTAKVTGTAGTTPTVTASATLTDVPIAGGLKLKTLTITLAASGITVSGTAEIGVGAGKVMQLQVDATITDADNWDLTVTTVGSPTWRPFPGLTVTPDITGHVTSATGPLGTPVVSFSLSAGNAAPGAPLATWQAAPGASVVVQTIGLSNEGNVACAAVPDGPEGAGHLVLDFAGAVTLGTESTITVKGCVDLDTTAFHFQATADQLKLTDGFTLSNVELTALRRAGSELDLDGKGTLTIDGLTLQFAFALTNPGGAFVVGVQADLNGWGVPVQGYVVYASAPVDGYATGVATVGDGGVIDLVPGFVIVARYAPDPSGPLGAPSPQGLGLTSIDVQAAVPAVGDVTLRATATFAKLPFLPLADTSATATLTFTNTPAGNVVTFVLDATIVDPAGTTTVHLDFATQPDGSFTGNVKVDDLPVFGTTIDLTGKIDRKLVNAVFVTTASATATIPGPIDVAPSVQLRNLSITLGTEKLEVGGSVTIAGQTGFTISGQYFSKPNAALGFEAGGWSLDVSASNLSWTPTPGVSFSANFTGSVKRTGPLQPVGFQVAVTGPGGGDVFSFEPAGAPVKLAVKSAALGNAVAAPAKPCVTTPGDLWLTVEGSFTADIAGTKGTATGAGCFDLTSGQLSITADLSGLSVDLGGGNRLNGPRFTVARTAATPPATSAFRVSAEVSIDLDIMGKSYSSPKPGTGDARLTAQLVYTEGTFVVGVRANFSDYVSGVGGDAVLYFASAAVSGFDTGVPAVGKVDLVKGINFAVRLTLPSVVADGLSKTGDGVEAPKDAVTAIGQIDIEAHAFIFKVKFESKVGGVLYESGDTKILLTGGFLKFTVTPTDVAFGLGLSAQLTVPPAEGKGAPSIVPFTGEISFSTQRLVVSLQVGDCKVPAAAWTNAFGISGLTIQCAAIQGGITFATGLPTFGLMAKVKSLPPVLADAIGYEQGAPIELAFNFDPFLVSMSIGEKSSPKVALRPLKAVGEADLIRVRYASLYIAPVAVTIGQTIFPAGYGLGFQADIAGVDVDVLASVDPNKPSISFKADVSRIDIGALSIGPVHVDLLANPSDFHFELTAKMKLGPGTLEIGPALRVGGELAADIEVQLSTKGLAAFFSGHARGFVGVKVPHDWCYWGGFVPYPCEWEWEDGYIDLTLGRTGFSVDGEGLTLSFDGHSITLPWSGGGSDAIEAGPIDSSAVLAERTARTARPLGGAVASSPTALAPSGSTQADGDLAVATPTASEQPMAAAPLPDELVIPAADLVAGLTIVAPPTGPTGTEERPPGETTEVVVSAAPAVVEGTAPGAWTPTGDLHAARTAAVAANLPDGRVLVAGGSGSGGALASAEVYDPESGAWSPTGSMAHARAGAVVATLPDGRILVAGGTDGDASGTDVLSSVELYDPDTGQWSAGPALAGARAFATATVLADGRVLVAGGLGPDGPVATAERFDPSTGTWQAVGSLGAARGFAAASRLADGRVLVAGGQGVDDAVLASAELFDPAAATWRGTTDMPSSSMMDTATTLSDGRVLVAGADANGKLFDPATATWSKTGALGTIRLQAAAVTLPDGDVLLVGGFAGATVETNGEIYDVATNAWQRTTDLPVATAAASAVVLDDGSVLAVGGSAGQGAPLAAASIYRAVETVEPVAFQSPDVVPVAVPTTTVDLPPLGTEAVPVALFAVVLIVAGAVVVRRTRRRTNTTD